MTDTERLNWLFATPKNFGEITSFEWQEFRDTTEKRCNSKSSADWFREIIDAAIATQKYNANQTHKA